MHYERVPRVNDLFQAFRTLLNWSLYNFQNGGFEAQLAGKDVGRLQREDGTHLAPLCAGQLEKVLERA